MVIIIKETEIGTLRSLRNDRCQYYYIFSCFVRSAWPYTQYNTRVNCTVVFKYFASCIINLNLRTRANNYDNLYIIIYVLIIALFYSIRILFLYIIMSYQTNLVRVSSEDVYIVPPTSMWTGAVYLDAAATHGMPAMVLWL